MKDVLIKTKKIGKTFRKGRDQKLEVLQNVDLAIHEGEIVALLGKSGSGKSTFLRVIAGLIEPTSGEVLYRDQVTDGPVPGIAMVFQSFALLPWLTVLQNVELGLEALGVSADERRTRALKAIDSIGLDGFESALPKELSGGMRQRVGFARALVVEPDLLLLDEPFSALDVLTAENLRSDLLDIWREKKIKTNGILIVTHNIEEAALLADRVIIFKSDPGGVRAELKISLKHPRNEQDPSFRKVVDDIYTLMTSKPTEAGAYTTGVRFKTIDLNYRLPNVEISELIGLLESMTAPEFAGRVDLPKLADELHLTIDDLFPLTDALEILRFATVSEGDIELTETGRRFAQADLLERKQLFANNLIHTIPLARHIRHVLNERPGQRASEQRFLSELEDFFSEKEAERVLAVVIEWGRYAELFAYDYNTGMLSLENPE